MSVYDLAQTEAIDTDLRLITPPVIEPLDLDFVKKQRRVSGTALDSLFDLWISAARQYVEEQTTRQLMTATWDYLMDGFPVQDEIEIPRPPLQSIIGVYYKDGDSVEQEFDASNYEMTAPSSGYMSRRGRIGLAAGSSWPTTSSRARAVRIRFKAGYGDAPGSVPELERHVLMTIVGHFHQFGESVQQTKPGAQFVDLPMGASNILKLSMYAAQQTLVPRRYAWGL